MNSGLCVDSIAAGRGPQQSESGAPTRPRRLHIVACGVIALRLDAQRSASRFLGVRSFEGAVEFVGAAAREVLEIGAARLVGQPQTRHTRANERARASSEVASLAVQQCKCYASPADNQTPELFAQASVLHPLASFFRTRALEAAPAASETRTLKETTKRT